MGKVQQYKRGISAFISSENGQRFFNFAYSIGAAIVIWGALFKILHLPGGNMLLSIGMGTEVLMFVLTAFDRPPREYHWEDVFPALRKESDESEDEESRGPVIIGGGTVYAGGAVSGNGSSMPKVTASQARRAVGIPQNIDLSEEDSRSLSESISKMAAAADQLSRMAELTSATQTYLDQMAAIAADMQQLHAVTSSLNQVSQTLLDSYKAITENSASISESARGYVDQMQALDRNIGGLNTIYELQLRSVSSQIDSIDRVNRGIKDIRDMYEKSASQSARYCEETERMARYMHQLNAVYEKMLTAMTVNMYRPGMTPPDIDGRAVNTDAVQAERNR
ncbi:MAG: gliding motility protein GldL [Muribaculaceae bacterium]|nr:gliding motility protein GldL [Muribaculaceae bacterium]